MRNGVDGRVVRASALVYLDVIAKIVLLGSLALVVIDPEWGHLTGKAPTLRALTYPLLAFAVPLWWFVRRPGSPYPWLPDLLLTFTAFSDILGNRLNFYDRITWFDEWMHFAAVASVSAALVLLTTNSTASSVTVLERSVALGMTAALTWELFEYFAFITRSAELPTAYADTIGDLTMGWLGTIAAWLVVHHSWRHHLGLNHSTVEDPSASTPRRGNGPASVSVTTAGRPSPAAPSVRCSCATLGAGATPGDVRRDEGHEQQNRPARHA